MIEEGLFDSYPIESVMRYITGPMPHAAWWESRRADHGEFRRDCYHRVRRHAAMPHECVDPIVIV